MLSKIRKSIVIMSTIYVALGVALIVYPGSSLNAVSIFLGSVSLVYGIANIISGIKERKIDGTITEIVIGALLSTLGIILVITPRFFTTLIIIFFGIYIIIEGLNSIKKANTLKKMRYDRWWATLIAALAVTILGILIVVNPFNATDIVVIFIGVSFVFNGVTSLIVAYLLAKASKGIPDIE